MPWALSYIGSNFALIAVIVLAVAALGAVAWFAKNWKVAAWAVGILCAGLAYQHIDKTAYQRRVSEEAFAQVRALEQRLSTVNQINQANAERAIDDAAEIGRLKSRANQTPPNSGSCLDSDAAGRVRSIR